MLAGARINYCWGSIPGATLFAARLAELGIELRSEEALNTTFMRFKELADKKHDIFDEDLQALISDEAMALQEHYKLLSLIAHSETGETPYATSCSPCRGRKGIPLPRLKVAARWMPLFAR